MPYPPPHSTMEGHWEFQGGGECGSQKAKVFEGQCEAKLLGGVTGVEVNPEAFCKITLFINGISMAGLIIIN